MKKKVIKFIILLLITLGIVGASLYLVNNKLYTYAIVTTTLAVIFFAVTLANIPRHQTENDVFKHNLKQILKKYDAILAEIGNIPNLDDKNIMQITNISDMVDAAIEIRKPVYYKKEETYCIFSLLDNQDTCIYILKENPDEETDIEKAIKNRKSSIEKSIEETKEKKKKKEWDKNFSPKDIEGVEKEDDII